MDILRTYAILIVAVLSNYKLGFLENIQNWELCLLAQQFRSFFATVRRIITQTVSKIKNCFEIWFILIFFSTIFFQNHRPILLHQHLSQSPTTYWGRSDCKTVNIHAWLAILLLEEIQKEIFNFVDIKEQTLRSPWKRAWFLRSKLQWTIFNLWQKTTGLDCCRFWFLHEKLHWTKTAVIGGNFKLAQTQLKFCLANIVLENNTIFW